MHQLHKISLDKSFEKYLILNPYVSKNINLIKNKPNSFKNDSLFFPSYL